jgi:hypothetical protein
MKRVIKSRTTGLYLREDGAWTTESAEAQDFLDVRSAIEAQQRYSLRDCELMLQMGPEPSAEYDIALPLSQPKPYQKSSPKPPESENDLRKSA